MSISQKINASTFFSPCDILQINNFSSNQNLFNYLNNYSNIQQPLINIQSLNNFLFNFNNSININNITIKNILKEDEHSNLINDKNEVNHQMNKVSITKKIVEEDDFRTKWKTEKCHNLETYGHCKFGENCAFAHGDDELKEKIKNYNYKSKPCEQFFEKGFCSYGRRCQFSHKIKNTDIYYNFDSKLIIDNKNYINYSQILSKLLLNRQIFLKVVKKPRLMIFKKIANISQKEIEENRLKLYLDIIDLNDNIQKI